MPFGNDISLVNIETVFLNTRTYPHELARLK